MPISTIDNFNINAKLAIDSRMVASNSTVRDAIAYKYDGLKVFQLDTRYTYVWNQTSFNTTGITSSSWDVEGGGGSIGTGTPFRATMWNSLGSGLNDTSIVVAPIDPSSEQNQKIGIGSAPKGAFQIDGNYTQTYLGGTPSNPFVIDKGAARTTLGDNWYYSSGDKYSNIYYGSSVIDLNNGSIIFKGRTASSGNSLSTYFTIAPTLNSTSNDISVNGTRFGSTATSIYITKNGFNSTKSGSTHSVFIGVGAGTSNKGSDVIAVGLFSAANNIGSNVNAMGSGTVQANGGSDVNGFGYHSLALNTGNNVNAFGKYAGSSNTYENVNLFGYYAEATADGQTVFSTGLTDSSNNIISAIIGTSYLTQSHLIQFPNNDGTFVVSVNGTTASGDGSITLLSTTYSFWVQDNTYPDWINGPLGAYGISLGTMSVDDNIVPHINICSEEDGGPMRIMIGTTAIGGSLHIGLNGAYPSFFFSMNDGNFLTINTPNTSGMGFGWDNTSSSSVLQMSNIDSSYTHIYASLLTGGRSNYLPDNDGTFVLSVNGVTASSDGNIDIPTLPNYRIYTAILDQSDTRRPTDFVLDNQLSRIVRVASVKNPIDYTNQYGEGTFVAPLFNITRNQVTSLYVEITIDPTNEISSISVVSNVYFDYSSSDIFSCPILEKDWILYDNGDAYTFYILEETNKAWTRNATGVYYLGMTGGFIGTVPNINGFCNINDSTNVYFGEKLSDDLFRIITKNISGTYVDNALLQTPVDIRVYDGILPVISFTGDPSYTGLTDGYISAEWVIQPLVTPSYLSFTYWLDNDINTSITSTHSYDTNPVVVSGISHSYCDNFDVVLEAVYSYGTVSTSYSYTGC